MFDRATPGCILLAVFLAVSHCYSRLYFDRATSGCMSLLLQAVFCCYWWPHLTYVFLVLAGCFQTTQCLSGPSSGLSTHNTRARSVSFPVRKFANGSNQSRCQVRRALSITLNVLIGVRAAHVIVWWQLWGGSTPALQYVGMRVTAQTTAASATE